MKNRSRIHMLYVAAARLEEDHANPKLVVDLRGAAQEAASKKAQGRAWSEGEERRVEKQRTLFAMLPSSNTTDRLKEGIMQRTYDLLWDGDCAGADALLEFLPSKEADAILDAWAQDQDGQVPKSRWHGGLD